MCLVRVCCGLVGGWVGVCVVFVRVCVCGVVCCVCLCVCVCVCVFCRFIKTMNLVELKEDKR